MLSSCKKDSFITSSQARVIFTTDSLKYDTVFTTTGSITKSFKIINENTQKLRLSKVKLMGGAASAFKININGMPATELNDVDIAANDSIYIFASVTVNPNAANLPFIISDSILINYNGNDHFVQLKLMGKMPSFYATRLLAAMLPGQIILPYVILGSVRIDTTANINHAGWL
ncbi:MAG: hypothetical protein WDM90_16525 [Ferruginibacter sp.]